MKRARAVADEAVSREHYSSCGFAARFERVCLHNHITFVVARESEATYLLGGESNTRGREPGGEKPMSAKKPRKTKTSSHSS
jgi:hypothetical protein